MVNNEVLINYKRDGKVPSVEIEREGIAGKREVDSDKTRKRMGRP